MEQTKVYAVIERSVGMSSYHKNPVAVFLSKIDAEFYAWKKGRSARNDSFASVFFCESYMVQEVPVLPASPDDSSMKKFLKERRKEIEEEITANKEHSNQDLEKVAALEEQLKSYT